MAVHKALVLKEQTGFRGHTDSFDQKLLFNKQYGPLTLYKKIVLFSSKILVYMDRKSKTNSADKEPTGQGIVTVLILSIVAIIKKLLRDFFRIST